MNGNIQFKEEKRGYCKAEINKYIDMVSAEYQKMQDKYIVLTKNNNSISASLEEASDNAKLLRSIYEAQIEDLKSQLKAAKSNNSTNPNADIISRILIDAEVMAKVIVDKARLEADQIKYDANKELEKITAAKNQVLDQFNRIQAVLDTFIK